MKTLSERLGDEEFHNWLDVAVSINITNDGIVDFLKNKIKNLHRRIKYGACAALPYCSDSCSKTKTNLSTWCYTCTKWKSQIMLYNRYAGRRHKIKWPNINSEEWPANINELVKVFAPEWWNGTTCYTEDLTVAISVIHNCTEFVFPAGVCQGVRDVRNGQFAHGSQRASAVEKKEALRKLILFLTQPEIAHTQTGQRAIKMLKLLQKRKAIDIIVDDRNTYMKCQLLEVVYPTGDEERNLMNKSHEIQYLRIALQNLDIRKEQTKHRVGYFRRQPLLICLCVIGLLGVLTYLMGRSSQDFMKQDSPLPFHMQSNCLPLQFSSPCPWTPDIIFDTYLQDHPTLFGRKWLLERIQNTLVTTSGKGILLSAEMGYGKSALAAHIVCGGDLPEINVIRKHLLSYHICKFDVLKTQKPEYFIRNLVGMMINFLPEVGNEILSDNQAMKVLETKECSEDPIYCFDVVIVHPLRRVTFDEDQYIVIDAIDECVENESLPVSLVHVISNRLGKLPGWIKFFITARNIPVVTSKLKMLKRLDLTSTDAENQEDIRKYLNYKFSDDSSIFLPLFKTTTEKNNVIENLVKISRAHFLYVVLALKEWNQNINGSIVKFPQSLNDLYALNLERAFRSNYEKFSLARGIFEVLCTTSRPLTLSDLEQILNVRSDPYPLRNILGNQLAHFIRNNRSINIYHKTICDYLSSNVSLSSPFHISISTGHALFAKYMLKKIKRGKAVDDDVIDLVIHIVEAKDEDLLDSFQKSKSISRRYSSTAPNILHKMARRKDSFDATKLLVDASDIKNIDKKSSANVTACFLAAAFGNVQTLKYLVEKGCNISFRVNRHPDVVGLDDVVNYCKQKALWGYGLLDIASQNGHINVVDMLLSLKNMGYPEKNGLGLTPVHLAAENGHTEILAKLLAKDNTSADQHSLYLASKHGHTDVVSLLLKYGVQDPCLRCDGEFYWLKNNTKRMQWNYCFNSTDQVNCVIETSDHFESPDIVLHDDERVIKCTTALEIAIQNGHTDIVRILLKQRVNALNCREYGGRTPLLTSIKYNQIDIFDMILETKGDAGGRCVSTSRTVNTYNQHQLNMNELMTLDRDRCPAGAGAQHLLAMYDRVEMVVNLYRRGLNLNWKENDNDGGTPLHYSACNNGINMIKLIIRSLHISPTIRAKNGSTPIHSTVLCNALNSYLTLKDLSTPTESIEDDEGRGLLHYLSLSQGSADMFYVINHETYGMPSSMRDRNLNNFLHYAADAGQANVILYAYETNSSNLFSLFHEKNSRNKTMFDIAFDKLPNNSTLYSPLGCNFFEMFFQSCKINYKLLPKEEYFIFVSFQIAMQYPEIQRMIDFQRYARIAISKSNTLILLCICVYKPSYMTLSVSTETVRAFFDLDKPPQYMASILLRYSDDLCNLPFKESLVHRIIRNKANKFWIYFADSEFQFGSEMLHKGNISFWRKCLDNDGFNILHHAVMGGNYFAVRYLLDKGMGLSGSKGKSLLYFSVWNAPLPSNVRIVLSDYRDIRLLDDNKVLKIILKEISLADYDRVSVYLFRKIHKKGKVAEKSLCNSTSTRLSLVHRAAIVGMVELLSVIGNKFGYHVLKCRNIHNFTPHYLAKLFNRLPVIEYLEKRSVMLVYPDKIAEKVFLRALSTHLTNSSEFTKTPNYQSLVIKFSHPYWYKIENEYLPNVILERKLKQIKSDFNTTLHELSKFETVVNTTMRSNMIHIYHKISAGLLEARKESFYIRESREGCQSKRSYLPYTKCWSNFQRNNFLRRHFLTKLSKQLTEILENVYLYYEISVTASFIADSNFILIFSYFHALRLTNISHESLIFIKRFHILNSEFLTTVKTNYVPDTSNILKPIILYEELYSNSKIVLKKLRLLKVITTIYLKLFRNLMNTINLPLEDDTLCN